MGRRLKTLAAVLTLALPAAAGCREDDSLTRPDLANNNGLFERYISLGNSIAAGFQSGGINDSTQRQAFPVLLAGQAGLATGTEFSYPTLAGRGCPPPLTNNVTGIRVGGDTLTGCDLRVTPTPALLNNLAVPGAQAQDLLSNTATAPSTYERLATVFLGGRTEVQAMMAAAPTLVTVEIGANDVLGALLSESNPGDPAQVTPAAVFEEAYGRVADSIARTGARAALLGVPDVTVVPFASTGATYWCLKTGLCPGIPAAFPPTFSVADNCAPGSAVPGAIGDSVLIPWTIGVVRVLQAGQGAATAVDCSLDAETVTPAEFAGMRAAVAAYNASIATQAAAHGWAYVDLNAPLAALRVSGGVPPFPDISAVASGGPVGFGPYFSLDGFHPSAATHRILTDSVASALNRAYRTALPLLGP